jgi:hypothetical protein
MGLLDEAIREHLQLKRQHGADPNEVARLEHEALGPAVRETHEVLEAAPAAAAAPAEPVETPAEVPAVDDAVGEGLTADSGVDPADAGLGATAPFDAQEIFSEDAGAAPGAETSVAQPVPPAEPAAPPEPPMPEPEATEPPPTEVAPAEPVPAESAPAEPAPASAEPAPPEPAGPPPDEAPADPTEDVLEETPDFLQETPEHDRLWFEQKPPRDFDFDS